MRTIFLDTETTGLSPKTGHRLIEIGCVEMKHRTLTGEYYHTYLNPKRQIDESAIAVHGLTAEFLADKPLFKSIANEFIEYIQGATLVIHNAPFDVGFLNHELSSLGLNSLENYCADIIDSLTMARKMYPGKKNSLDALCQRFNISNSHRTYHGALIDSHLLSQVYLKLTGGQSAFDFAPVTSLKNSEVQERFTKVLKLTISQEVLNEHAKLCQDIGIDCF